MEQSRARVEKRILDEEIEHQPRVESNKKKTLKVVQEVGDKKTEPFKGEGHDGVCAAEKIAFAESRSFTKNIVTVRRE
jgi:hypothetical protein